MTVQEARALAVRIRDELSQLYENEDPSFSVSWDARECLYDSLMNLTSFLELTKEN